MADGTVEATLAAWLFLYDSIAAAPFRAPAVLGAVAFAGLREASEHDPPARDVK